MKAKLIFPLFAGLFLLATVTSTYATGEVEPSPTPTVSPTPKAKKNVKVNLCHKTRSKKNPYTVISVSEKAAQKHLAKGDTLYGGELKENGRPVRNAKAWCVENLITQ